MVKLYVFPILVLSALLIEGCSYAPGLDIPESALSYETHDNGLQVKNNSLLEVALDLTHGQETAMPTFVTNIDANLIVSQDHEQANHAPPEDLSVLCRQTAQNDEYRVGPQDVLSFTVWDHPELTSPSNITTSGMAFSPMGAAAPQAVSSDVNGHVVSKQGIIFFPYVGEVAVAGHTLGEIRAAITQALTGHIIKPQLDVRVVSYRSKKVYVTGEVKMPGAIPITDTPLSVVEAVAHAQGFTQEADTFRATVLRGKQSYPVDLNALFNSGDLSQNCLLQDGDIVHVPDRGDSRVYVMGEVTKANLVYMKEGRMNLAQAINLAGLNQETSDARRVFVIRGAGDNPATPLVYHLDLSNPGALLLSTRFALKPLDVVYVSTASVTRWNRIVSQILPLISTLASTNYYATH